MTRSPARSAWRAPKREGGPYVRGPVRGSGPGAIRADDEWIDEEAVRRGALHHEDYRRWPIGSLTLAERCEVVARLAARYGDEGDVAVHLGWSVAVVRAYAHWEATGEWIPVNDVTRVLAERASCETTNR